jgi:hypothetical protein
MTHYSPSSLRLFQACNLQWRYRYLDGIKTPSSAAATVGKAVHKSIEANLRAKMMGLPLVEEAAADVARDAVTAGWAEVGDTEEATQDESRDKAARLSRLHHKLVAPHVEALALEERVEVQPPGRDYSLVLIADIREKGLIRDTKTTGKSPPKDAATRGGNADQMTAYSLAFGVERIQLDYLVDTKTPAVVSLPGERTTADHGRLLRKYDLMHKQIQAGVFLPAPGDSWACSQKYCGWWNSCQFGGG